MPWNAVGDFVLGLIKQKKLQQWWQLWASFSVTAFLNFWFTWGTVGGALLSSGSTVSFSLTMGFFSACTWMAVRCYMLLHRHPMTKEWVYLVGKDLNEKALVDENQSVVTLPVKGK